MNTELETPASDFLNENWEQPNNEEGVYDPNTLTEENLLNINNNNNVEKEEEEEGSVISYDFMSIRQGERKL